MFGFKNNKNNYQPVSPDIPKRGSGTAGEDFPLHTMQDDLNAIEGLTAPPEEARQYSDPERKKDFFAPPKRHNSAEYRPDTSQSSSPFLNVPPSPKFYSPASRPDDLSKKSGPSLPRRESKTPVEQYPKRGFNWKKILLVSALIISFLALAAGGYYFWLTRNASAPAPTPEAVIPSPAEEPIAVEKIEEKFSAEKPNYLSIDTEIATPETLKQTLAQTASEIKKSETTSPIEFIITDSNNNPIVFHIFAVLSGLKLSPVLSNLGEEFSLFFYPDSENVRIGIAADLKDKGRATAAMKNQEKTLINDLSFLFLDAVPQEKDKLFQSSTYKDFSIRYANLNPEESLSIDYAVTADQLVIGTSKNTIRAILDKIAL
ncbi:MAG: hypothetical protein NT136_00350 [Candidatus Moranbacteria bacterium]|nr:hypothetical protein [Candidatus Moranbacteria bacterium]